VPREGFEDVSRQVEQPNVEVGTLCDGDRHPSTVRRDARILVSATLVKDTDHFASAIDPNQFKVSGVHPTGYVR
jgi:hypothetical protein